MDSILVTGGAGFIGSEFVRQWLAETPGRVVVLDKLTYAASRASLAAVESNERLVFCQGDIGDAVLVRKLLVDYTPRAVLNFAAESHVDRSIDSPSPFAQTNVVGTCQLLEEAVHYWGGLPATRQAEFRFLQISTDEVFGPILAPDLANEQSRYAPSSPYAASKAAADHFVRAAARTYGLPTLISHSTNNFGPFQFPEKLVPLMIRHALAGRSLPLYGDGSQVRDWIYVEDHCRAVRELLRLGLPGESYNIGGNCRCSNLKFVKQICQLVDQLRPDLPGRPTESLIEFVADRPGHDVRYALDTTKLRQLTDWTCRRDFAESLELTVRWYLQHPEWVESMAQDFSLGARLGGGVR